MIFLALTTDMTLDKLVTVCPFSAKTYFQFRKTNHKDYIIRDDKQQRQVTVKG